ncbi:type IV pilin protein [Bilifractor sp. HCP3S3_D3]|uniref:type IV pilin protein n=1 Tax=Bilifractor sp. HCP3S3_D3 TaxID=3438907 RepID=UPI003F8AB7AE
MRREDNKGFTLAELLIVVAIIGVLVAISIPIFSKQLEKARDATSVANLRSAYAEAQTEVLSPSASKGGYTDSTHHIALVFYPDGSVKSVTVYGVVLKSKKRNNWSELGNNLPFYSKITGNNSPGSDTGVASTAHVTFSYSDGDGSLESVIIIH